MEKLRNLILCAVSLPIVCTFNVHIIIAECGFKAVHRWTVESSKPPTLHPVWRMRQMGWSRKPVIEQWRLCPVRQEYKCSQHPNARRRSSSSDVTATADEDEHVQKSRAGFDSPLSVTIIIFWRWGFSLEWCKSALLAECLMSGSQPTATHVYTEMRISPTLYYVRYFVCCT